MSDLAVHTESASTDSSAPAETAHQAPENPFDAEDIASFRDDDREAVSRIGELLVACFFYSLVVMIIVAIVTCMSDWV